MSATEQEQPGIKGVHVRLGRSEVASEIASAGKRPSVASWPPDHDRGWEEYHAQMFDLSRAPNGFVRWKMLSTGVNIARKLAHLRNFSLSEWEAQHGERTLWCTSHPPVVLWTPEMYQAACLGCMWLGRSSVTSGEAEVAARVHSLEADPSGELPESALAVQRWPSPS